MKLSGKVALVTGGAERIGRALSLALAGEGVRVAIHFGRSAAQAEETAAEIRAIGGNALTVQADLRRLGDGRAAELISRAAALGPLDILVNNAALFEAGGVTDTSEECWDRHFAVNLKAPFFLSQAFAVHVGRIRPAHIVNIADGRVARPAPDHIAYSLTKAALITMTRSMARALAPNIRVNGIAPGAILPPPGKGMAYLDKRKRSIPLNRIGSPEDIARALVFLLGSDFVTGELISVTGGEFL